MLNAAHFIRWFASIRSELVTSMNPALYNWTNARHKLDTKAKRVCPQHPFCYQYILVNRLGCPWQPDSTGQNSLPLGWTLPLYHQMRPHELNQTKSIKPAHHVPSLSPKVPQQWVVIPRGNQRATQHHLGCLPHDVPHINKRK